WRRACRARSWCASRPPRWPTPSAPAGSARPTPGRSAPSHRVVFARLWNARCRRSPRLQPPSEGETMAQGSTMFTVGTLLRHAEEASAPVRVLVGTTWVDGVVVGADGMGVVLDDGNGSQVLVRLESIVAVSFSR